MENGSFHTSDFTPLSASESQMPPDGRLVSRQSAASATEKLEELVKSIPLPNQMPQGVNFRDIPAAALKSSTLESLISQNEDLMARLSVSLRKANQFEEKAGMLARENEIIKSKMDTIREQFMVLQEKDRFASARSHQLLEENGTTKEHMQRLEKVYSDLFVQAQTFQRRLQQLERYRARVQRIGPSLQEKAKRAEQLEGELEHTRKTLSISHMQTVNSYEAKLAEARQQVDTLRGKAEERDQIFEEKVRSQNELVSEKRVHQAFRADVQPLIENMTRETAALRFQLKESLLAHESERQQLADALLEKMTMTEETTALKDQVESLQALWAHKQRELDQLEEKNASLQKLNQSLSMNLNQQRKEIQNLQQEMETERFAAQDGMKTLKTEIEMLRNQPKPD